MQTVDFPLPPMKEDGRVDLGMMLIGQSGVEGIDFLPGSVRVTYDPDFSGAEVLENLLRGSGYATRQAAGAR